MPFDFSSLPTYNNLGLPDFLSPGMNEEESTPFGTQNTFFRGKANHRRIYTQ